MPPRCYGRGRLHCSYRLWKREAALQLQAAELSAVLDMSLAVRGWGRQACRVLMLDYSWLQHYHGLMHREGHMGRISQHP